LTKDPDLEGGEFICDFVKTQQFQVYSEELIKQVNGKDRQKRGILDQLAAKMEKERTTIEMCEAIIQDHKIKKKEAEEHFNAVKESYQKMVTDVYDVGDWE